MSISTGGLIVFLLGSAAIVFISRRPLQDVHSHGFYRFFAWEILFGMFLLNINRWFHDPLAWHQLISWILLIISIPLVLIGMGMLRSFGKQARDGDPALLGLEKTSRLVTDGLYRYIRHPLYSSLLFLGWGLFFKSPSWLEGGLVLFCTFFLVMTAHVEERENIAYFGEDYTEYIKHSKMFIPFIL